MLNLSSSRKGAVAEAAITAALIQLGLVVLRPMCAGGGTTWSSTGRAAAAGPVQVGVPTGSVLTARCATSRHTPGGYVRTSYSAEEVDAIAAYAPEPTAAS